MDPSDEWRFFAETASKDFLNQLQAVTIEHDQASQRCKLKTGQEAQEERKRCDLFVQRSLFKFMSRLELLNNDLESCWKKADKNPHEMDICKKDYTQELTEILDESIAAAKKIN